MLTKEGKWKQILIKEDTFSAPEWESLKDCLTKFVADAIAEKKSEYLELTNNCYLDKDKMSILVCYSSDKMES